MTNIIRNSALALALLGGVALASTPALADQGTITGTTTGIRGMSPITIGTGTTGPTATPTMDMPIALLIPAMGTIPTMVVPVSASLSANRYW